MLPIENKIVFTNGYYNAPYIDRIIEVVSDAATDFEDIKEMLFDVEKGKSEYRETAQIITQVFGNGFVIQYKSQTDGVYGWADRGYKRKNRRAVVADYIRKQNGAGNVGENQKIKV